MEAKKRQDGRAKSTRTSVSLSDTDYQYVAKIAAQKKVSIAWVIREAVERYLEANEPLFNPEERRWTT